MATISSDSNENSRPNSPPSIIPTIEAPELTVDQLDLASTLKLPSSTEFLSPTPPPSKPQYKFVLSDLYEGKEGGLETLGPEITSADINVAADGAFIETSSGPAARELKRRYDQLAGVGPSVRSPYAITAFVSQHGKSMYRIGHRDEHSAPGAAAAEVEERVSKSSNASDASQSPRTKRRSVLSMAMFTKSNPQTQSRPPTATSTTTTTSRKLQRRTRSIPDLFSAALEEKGETSGTTVPTFAVTGRGHSQSVTAVDIPRPSLVFTPPAPERKVDAFGELMDWFTPASSASSNFSTHSLFNPGKATTSADPSRPRAAVSQPFGPLVSFNVPSYKAPAEKDRLPPPRHLRVKQSFESGLTARPDDPSSYDSDSDHEFSRPPSAIRLSQLTSSSESSETPPAPEADETISPESLRLSSHYSTEVFNVLQTYRGLPLFEALVPEVDEGTTVIRLSLAADQGAAPRDDPRFVLWGETSPEEDHDDSRSNSRSRDSLDFSGSAASKRRSSKVSRMRSPEGSTSGLPSVEGPKKVLLAATIERWIAQLTSDLDYDELLNFFLTYRTYVSAVDLCHLLICRFHWALQKPSSSQDETVRRIVRVRTFVAIRYWLLTFFTVDFIPNRELRLLIADWLNTLLHDPILKQHSDGIGIVRRLAKVAKDCRRAHTRATEQPKPTSPPRSTPETPGRPSDYLLGKSFAEAIKKPTDEDDDSDLDLDFLPDAATSDEYSGGFPNDPANAHLSVAHSAGAGVLTSSRPTSLPLSSLNILQRTDHAPGPNADADLRLVHGLPLQSRHNSAVSRAFVKTIGRLGRWKRALNPRASISTPRPPTALGVCGAGVSAFDLEISASKDLLTDMNGGVEQYLKMSEAAAKSSTVTPPKLAANSAKLTIAVHPPPPAASSNRQPIPRTSPIVQPSTNASGHASPPSPISPLGTHLTLPLDMPLPTSEPPQPPPLIEPSLPAQPVEHLASPNALPPEYNEASHQGEDVAAFKPSSPRASLGSFDDQVNHSRESGSAESFRSSSTDSFGAPLTSDGPLPPTFPGSHNQWQFDVASIDELDLSDTSSIPDGDDLQFPPGLRKPARKLPMRRDFEFVRRSEVSSMGIVSHESMRDSVSSAASGSSPTSSSGGGPGPIHRWQMKSIQHTFEEMSNDEEGDVEAALRRLEGQISPKVQQEKSAKVDGWVRTMQERMANGDYEYESSLFSEDETEGFIDEIDQTSSGLDTERTSEDTDNDDLDGSAKTPLPTQTTHQVPSPPGLGTSSTDDLKPLIEEAVPLEILQSRMSSEVPAAVLSPPIKTTLSSKFAKDEAPRVHKSFVIDVSTSLLAQHFSMIDRELFMGVKFEELVMEDWAECEEIEVLDWAQYLKDRARWKAESRFAEKTTALAALRARFNLMVSFVIAEVVLSPPAERHSVVGIFIRTAWKLYLMSNFHTLTAIVTALQSDWVNKAMRKHGWGRITSFEARLFRDLKGFISSADDFKIIRRAVDAVVDAKPLDSNSRTSVVSGGASDSLSGKGKLGSESRSTACIPFIGIYLAQLRRLNKLPALIDPTAPQCVVYIDPISANFDPPAHPEVFSNLAPLPSSMHLEPLINVHKQRLIADVIKRLVAGQHSASRVKFEVDKKLFQKCLKLRGLDPTFLQRALAIYTD